MLNSIRYNLSKLTDFSGRDARQTFWYYILFLVVVNFVIGLLVSIPMMLSMFNEIFAAIGSGTGEPDPDAIAAGMADSMSGYIPIQVVLSAVIGIAMIGLMLAAFVRRLHDAGFSGWIAAIPVATQVFSIVYSFLVIDDVLAAMANAMDPANSPDAMAIQAEAAPYSAVGWIGYLVVIGFGILKSQDGSNKYGDEPVRH